MQKFKGYTYMYGESADRKKADVTIDVRNGEIEVGTPEGVRKLSLVSYCDTWKYQTVDDILQSICSICARVRLMKDGEAIYFSPEFFNFAAGAANANRKRFANLSKGGTLVKFKGEMIPDVI